MTKKIGDIRHTRLQMEGQHHLKLVYENGDVCESDTTKRYSTLILLSCPAPGYQIEAQPTFLYQASCQYHFLWTTPGACVVQDANVTSGDECKVTLPSTGQVIDLSSLKNPDGYTVESEGHTYKFNICDKVTGTDCSEDSGLCQTVTDTPEKHWDGGKFSDKLYTSNTNVFLNYTGGDLCHGKYYRSTVILFQCQPNTTATAKFQAETADCAYLIDFYTAYACPWRIDCTVKKDSDIYQLSNLMPEEGYVRVSRQENLHEDVYVSLCSALPSNLNCPTGASVCSKDMMGTIKSLGQARHQPEINDAGQVTIKYTNGDRCSSNPGVLMASTIVFICKKGIMEENIVYQGEENCMHIFLWQTSEVCTDKKDNVTTDCQFYDSSLDFTFDFSAVANDFSVKSNSYNGTYHIAPCGSLAVDGCENTHVCLTFDDGDQPVRKYGGASQTIFQQEGKNTYKMSYNQGEKYQDCSVNTAAYVLLKCLDDGRPTEHALQLRQEFTEDCAVIFELNTPLSCPPVKKPCIFYPDVDNYQKHFNLQRLARYGKWEVSKGKSTYSLNVCESVYKTSGCPRSAVACLTAEDGSVHALGRVESQQFSYNKKKKTIILSYVNGDKLRYIYGEDKCLNNGNNSAQVMISFTCGKTVGNPVFKEYEGHDCQEIFQFEWKTHMACDKPNKPLKIKDGKIDFNILGGYKLQMTDLDGSKSHLVNTDDGTKFALQVSTPISTCGSPSAACMDSVTSIGNYQNSSIFYEDDLLEFWFNSSAICATDPKTLYKRTIIDFQCDSNGKEPILVYNNSCDYMFTWGSPAVCEVSQMHAISDVSASKGHSVAIVVSVFVILIIIAVLAIVFHRQERRVACRYHMRRIFTRSSTPSFTYSQLADNDEDALLPNVGVRYGSSTRDHETDDDDLIL